MSDLIHLKGVILTHLATTTELKKAVLDLINCIDSDIDEAGGLTENDERDLAIQALDYALIGEAQDEEDEDLNIPNSDEDEDKSLLDGFGDDEKDKDD